MSYKTLLKTTSVWGKRDLNEDVQNRKLDFPKLQMWKKWPKTRLNEANCSERLTQSRFNFTYSCMSALKLKTCYCESKKIETGEFFLPYYDIESALCKDCFFFVSRRSHVKSRVTFSMMKFHGAWGWKYNRETVIFGVLSEHCQIIPLCF